MRGKFLALCVIGLAACAVPQGTAGSDQAEDATNLVSIASNGAGAFVVTCTNGTIEAPITAADINARNFCPHVATGPVAPRPRVLSDGVYRTVEGDPSFLPRCRWRVGAVHDQTGTVLQRVGVEAVATQGADDCRGASVLECTGSGANTTCSGANPVNNRHVEITAITDGTFTRRETLENGSVLSFTWVNTDSPTMPVVFERDGDRHLQPGNYAGHDTCNLSVQVFYRPGNEISHLIASRDPASCTKGGDEVYTCGSPDAQRNVTCAGVQATELRQIVVDTPLTFKRTSPDNTVREYARVGP
jgi:hypothetical protein